MRGARRRRAIWCCKGETKRSGGSPLYDAQMTRVSSPLSLFHEAVREWFSGAFEAPTRPQRLGWPAIARGESTLILAPTGSGKTLTAFLWCLNRLLFEPVPEAQARCRVLYISPLKALAVDVERNLRAPLVGISNVAAAAGTPVAEPAIAETEAVAADVEPAKAEAGKPEPAAPVSLQTIANAYRDYTRKSFEEFGSFFEQLSGVRSLDKAMEVQTEFVKRAYESSVAETQKIRELHRTLARQTFEPFGNFAGKTPETHNKS